MTELIASMVIAASISLTPAVPLQNTSTPATLHGAARAGVGATHAAPGSRARLQSSSRDSIKNGALIGLITGGVLGMLGGATGCASGEILDAFPEESSCSGAMVGGALIGGGIGAVLGAGVDALFEQAPGTGSDVRGRRTGVRVRWRF